MATVTGYTAERMNEIVNKTVKNGVIQGNNLVLVTYDGTEMVAGNVRGPVGPAGNSMIVVEKEADLPVYAAGTGQDTKVGFVNSTNDFYIWSDATLKWTKIASTVPQAVGDPILLATNAGRAALIGNTASGPDYGLEVTAAGGVLLKSLTDIRLQTTGGQSLVLPKNGGVLASLFLAIGAMYLRDGGDELRISDAANQLKSLRFWSGNMDGALNVEQWMRVKGAFSCDSSGNFGQGILARSLAVYEAVTGASANFTNNCNAGNLSAGEANIIGIIRANQMTLNTDLIVPDIYGGRLRANDKVLAPFVLVANGGPSGSPNGNGYWSSYCPIQIQAPPDKASALIAYNIAGRGWAGMFGMTNVGTTPALHALNLANTGYIGIHASAFVVIPNTFAARQQPEPLAVGSDDILQKMKGLKARVRRFADDTVDQCEVTIDPKAVRESGFDDIIVESGPHTGYDLTGLVSYLVDAVNALTARLEALEGAPN